MSTIQRHKPRLLAGLGRARDDTKEPLATTHDNRQNSEYQDTELSDSDDIKASSNTRTMMTISSSNSMATTTTTTANSRTRVLVRASNSKQEKAAQSAFESLARMVNTKRVEPVSAEVSTFGSTGDAQQQRHAALMGGTSAREGDFVWVAHGNVLSVYSSADQKQLLQKQRFAHPILCIQQLHWPQQYLDDTLPALLNGMVLDESVLAVVTGTDNNALKRNDCELHFVHIHHGLLLGDQPQQLPFVVTAMACIPLIPHSRDVKPLSISHRGTPGLLLGSRDGKVRGLDLATQRRVDMIQLESQVTSFCSVPDLAVVLAGTLNGHVYIVDWYLAADTRTRLGNAEQCRVFQSESKGPVHMMAFHAFKPFVPKTFSRKNSDDDFDMTDAKHNSPSPSKSSSSRQTQDSEAIGWICTGASSLIAHNHNSDAFYRILSAETPTIASLVYLRLPEKKTSTSRVLLSKPMAGIYVTGLQVYPVLRNGRIFTSFFTQVTDIGQCSAKAHLSRVDYTLPVSEDGQVAPARRSSNDPLLVIYTVGADRTQEQQAEMANSLTTAWVPLDTLVDDLHLLAPSSQACITDQNENGTNVHIQVLSFHLCVLLTNGMQRFKFRSMPTRVLNVYAQHASSLFGGAGLKYAFDVCARVGLLPAADTRGDQQMALFDMTVDLGLSSLMTHYITDRRRKRGQTGEYVLSDPAEITSWAAHRVQEDDRLLKDKIHRRKEMQHDKLLTGLMHVLDRNHAVMHILEVLIEERRMKESVEEDARHIVEQCEAVSMFVKVWAWFVQQGLMDQFDRVLFADKRLRSFYQSTRSQKERAFVQARLVSAHDEKRNQPSSAPSATAGNALFIDVILRRIGHKKSYPPESFEKLMDLARVDLASDAPRPDQASLKQTMDYRAVIYYSLLDYTGFRHNSRDFITQQNDDHAAQFGNAFGIGAELQQVIRGLWILDGLRSNDATTSTVTQTSTTVSDAELADQTCKNFEGQTNDIESMTMDILRTFYALKHTKAALRFMRYIRSELQELQQSAMSHNSRLHDLGLYIKVLLQNHSFVEALMFQRTIFEQMRASVSGASDTGLLLSQFFIWFVDNRCVNRLFELPLTPEEDAALACFLHASASHQMRAVVEESGSSGLDDQMSVAASEAVVVRGSAVTASAVNTNPTNVDYLILYLIFRNRPAEAVQVAHAALPASTTLPLAMIRSYESLLPVATTDLHRVAAGASLPYRSYQERQARTAAGTMSANASSGLVDAVPYVSTHAYLPVAELSPNLRVAINRYVEQQRRGDSTDTMMGDVVRDTPAVEAASSASSTNVIVSVGAGNSARAQFGDDLDSVHVAPSRSPMHAAAGIADTDEPAAIAADDQSMVEPSASGASATTTPVVVRSFSATKPAPGFWMSHSSPKPDSKRASASVGVVDLRAASDRKTSRLLAERTTSTPSKTAAAGTPSKGSTEQTSSYNARAPTLLEDTPATRTRNRSRRKPAPISSTSLSGLEESHSTTTIRESKREFMRQIAATSPGRSVREAPINAADIPTRSTRTSTRTRRGVSSRRTGPVAASHALSVSAASGQSVRRRSPRLQAKQSNHRDSDDEATAGVDTEMLDTPVAAAGSSRRRPRTRLSTRKNTASSRKSAAAGGLRTPISGPAATARRMPRRSARKANERIHNMFV
jgi:Nuclear pore complex assembly